MVVAMNVGTGISTANRMTLQMAKRTGRMLRTTVLMEAGLFMLIMVAKEA